MGSEEFFGEKGYAFLPKTLSRYFVSLEKSKVNEVPTVVIPSNSQIYLKKIFVSTQNFDVHYNYLLGNEVKEFWLDGDSFVKKSNAVYFCQFLKWEEGWTDNCTGEMNLQKPMRPLFARWIKVLDYPVWASIFFSARTKLV